MRNLLAALLALVFFAAPARAQFQTNPSTALGAVTTAAPSYTTNQEAPLSLDTSGNLRVSPGAIPAGSSVIGKVGIDQTTDITTNGVEIAPSSAAASALSHANTTALANSLVVKASAGNLYGFNCTAITGAAAGFCVVYNAAAAPGTGALTGSLVLDVCTFDTTNKGCSLSRTPTPVQYGTGIVILVTSAATPFTYTTGTDTAYITADYK